MNDDFESSVIPSTYEIMRANTTMAFNNRNKYAVQLQEKYQKCSPDYKNRTAKSRDIFSVRHGSFLDIKKPPTTSNLSQRPSHHPVREKYSGGIKHNIPIDVAVPLDNKDHHWKQSLRLNETPKPTSLFVPTVSEPPAFYQDDMKKWDKKFQNAI